MTKSRKVPKKEDPWFGKYIGAGIVGTLGVVLIATEKASLIGLILVSSAAAAAGVEIVNTTTPPPQGR